MSTACRKGFSTWSTSIKTKTRTTRRCTLCTRNSRDGKLPLAWNWPPSMMLIRCFKGARSTLALRYDNIVRTISAAMTATAREGHTFRANTYHLECLHRFLERWVVLVSVRACARPGDWLTTARHRTNTGTYSIWPPPAITNARDWQLQSYHNRSQPTRSASARHAQVSILPGLRAFVSVSHQPRIECQC